MTPPDALPFAGIIEGRPYPPTGLTTARWRAEVPARDVNFADVFLTQNGVRVGPLFGVTDRDSDAHPHVVLWQGRLYLEDGHHRVVRTAMTGSRQAMSMRVFMVEGTL